MNEFLEQLVRDLTNAYSRSQKCLVSVYHLAPQISEAFSSSLLLGANAIKATTLDPSGLSMLCLSLSACFLSTRFVLSFEKNKGLPLNAAVLEPVSEQWHLRQTSEPKSSLILTGGPSIWPFCTSVQGGYSRIRCSTVCVHSTLSEDASEVLVQPLYCGTEKATSATRVVAKPTPRLCIGVLATPKFTQEAQAFGYLNVSMIFFWQRRP